MPLAGVRGLGGLQVTRKAAAPVEAGPRLKQTMPETDAATVLQPAIRVADKAVKSEPVADNRPKATPAPNRLALMVWLGTLGLLLVAVGVWWFWWSKEGAIPASAPVAAAAPDPKPAVAPPPADPPATDPAAQPATDPAAQPATQSATQPATPAAKCSRAGLAALPGGLPALRKAAAACAETISADDLFALLEDAVSTNDSEALLVMGKLYDPAAQGP